MFSTKKIQVTVEAYVRVKFSQAPVIFTSAEARESLRDRPSKKNEKKNYKPISNAITVGSARNIVRVSNMIEAVRTDETLENMYYSKNEREPLIDMVFPFLWWTRFYSSNNF
jgi:hypothetical protein